MGEEFYSGQRVVFKDWDEMEKEYGLTSNGNIDCDGVFLHTMRPLCGVYCTIDYVYKKIVYIAEQSIFDLVDGHWFAITTDMIRPVENDLEINDKDLEAMLFESE